jgi:hypothetical protein
MAVYEYLPQQFDGQSLTASPFSRVWFVVPNSPVSTMRPVSAVGAEVIGLGTQHVRYQPQPVVLEVHCVLVDGEEATLQSFAKVFSEERGASYLTANDGNGATWRMVSQVIGSARQPGSLPSGPFIVQLWVPNPLWEENSATSDTDAITDADSHTMSPDPTNNGNRKTPPTLTVSPQAVKAKYYNSFLSSYRGFVYNPGDRYYSGPLCLSDESGADSAIDHAAEVTDGVTRALINEVGGIDATQTTIVFDGGVGGNPPVAGIGYIESEQIAWSGGGGGTTGTLTGVKRGVGGTTAATHAEDVAIKHSEGLENGDDIQVWWNGARVPKEDRWLGGANTASMRPWINVAIPPKQTVTLKADATAGSPADGGNLEANEDIALWPESGFVVIGTEVITYQSRDLANRRFDTIERGAWGTTAASHSAQDTVKRGDGLFTVSCGRGASDRTIEGGPPGTITRRPAIQLLSSKNNEWRYADEADDSLTTIYDPDEPARTAMFVPSAEVPSADGNLATGLRLETSAGATPKAGWLENVPVMGKLLIPRLILTLPQGIEAVASGITYDAQPRAAVRLRMLGRNKQGVEEELLDLQDVAEAAVPAGTIDLSAKDRVHELILNGVRASVFGEDSNTSKSFDLDAINEYVFQKIILDQQTKIIAVQFRLKDSGSAEFDFKVRIRDDTGETPNLGNILARFTGINGTFRSSAFTEVDVTNSWVLYEFTFAITSGIVLAAGTYWLEIWMTAHSSGELDVNSADVQTKHNLIYENVTGEPENEVCYFRVLHESGGPIQPEADVLASNAEAYFDKLILALDDGASTRQVPYVHRTSGFTNALYHASGTWANTTTSQNIELDAWMALAASLAIDCDLQLVTYTEGQHQWRIPGAITPDDADAWLSLNTGANTVQYNENDVVDTDVTVAHRGRKV